MSKKTKLTGKLRGWLIWDHFRIIFGINRHNCDLKTHKSVPNSRDNLSLLGGSAKHNTSSHPQEESLEIPKAKGLSKVKISSYKYMKL